MKIALLLAVMLIFIVVCANAQPVWHFAEEVMPGIFGKNYAGTWSFMNGSVGIGTTSPSQKLVVIGNLNVTGNITAGSGTIYIDSTNNRIGIGVVPSTALDVGSGVITGSGAGLTNLNANNLASGTVPSGRLSGTYAISITGSAASASNADTVDNYHASSLLNSCVYYIAANYIPEKTWAYSDYCSGVSKYVAGGGIYCPTGSRVQITCPSDGSGCIDSDTSNIIQWAGYCDGYSGTQYVYVYVVCCNP